MSMIKEKTDYDYGDYITVEQKRYGCKNEHYVYKVVTRMRSNKYSDVPATVPSKGYLHNEMTDVVSCIMCGVQEDTVVRFKCSDVKFYKSVAKKEAEKQEDMIEIITCLSNDLTTCKYGYRKEANRNAIPNYDIGKSTMFECFNNHIEEAKSIIDKYKRDNNEAT